MIIVLALGYVALLALLVKIGIIKLNTFWKVSPLIWTAGLFIVLFLPMQWGAPSGPCQYLQQAMKIVPNVSGQVQEVHVKPWQQVKRGDVLFTIDPVPFQAAIDSLHAQLRLAEKRLDQSQQLVAQKAGPEYEVQQYQSQVKAIQGQIESAQWNLDSTVVKAPADGVVMGVTVNPGQRVANSPSQGYLTLVVSSRAMIASIGQNYLRFVEVGQPVEVVLKALPGQILTGKVASIAAMNSQGQLASGAIPTAPDGSAAPFGVMLEFDDESLIPQHLGGGLSGSAAIYTESVAPTHGIRKIMMRMQAWKNYVLP